MNTADTGEITVLTKTTGVSSTVMTKYLDPNSPNTMGNLAMQGMALHNARFTDIDNAKASTALYLECTNASQGVFPSEDGVSWPSESTLMGSANCAEITVQQQSGTKSVHLSPFEAGLSQKTGYTIGCIFNCGSDTNGTGNQPEDCPSNGDFNARISNYITIHAKGRYDYTKLPDDWTPADPDDPYESAPEESHIKARTGICFMKDSCEINPLGLPEMDGLAENISMAKEGAVVFYNVHDDSYPGIVSAGKHNIVTRSPDDAQVNPLLTFIALSTSDSSTPSGTALGKIKFQGKHNSTNNNLMEIIGIQTSEYSVDTGKADTKFEFRASSAAEGDVGGFVYRMDASTDDLVPRRDSITALGASGLRWSELHVITANVERVVVNDQPGIDGSFELKNGSFLEVKGGIIVGITTP